MHTDRIPFLHGSPSWHAVWKETLMVLIASNYPIGERGSNGLANLRGAVTFLRKPPCSRGAFVIYRDGNGKMPVYLSTRIREADPYGDQFTAFGGVPFGYMEEEFVPVISEKIPPAGSFQKTGSLYLKPVQMLPGKSFC